MTKGEKLVTKIDSMKLKTKGRDMTKEGDQLTFEHTSRGSKLINLFVAFGCAITYGCLHCISCKLQDLSLYGVC